MSKLLNTIREIPTGAIVVSPWLQDLGVNPQLVQKYEKSGWLKQIGFGAYTKVDNKNPNWLGGIYALQNGSGLSVHPGGRTALELLNQTHFVPMGEKLLLFIYNHSEQNRFHLPTWFSNYFKAHTFSKIEARLFSSEQGLQDHDLGNFTIKISSAERAVLEVLALIPSKKITFDQAALLIEGQVYLRPKQMQTMLESCRSQLVKRLFLYLAEYYQLPCFSKLSIEPLDLGVGKRVVESGGVFVQKLNLLVPPLNKDGSL